MFSPGCWQILVFHQVGLSTSLSHDVAADVCWGECSKKQLMSAGVSVPRKRENPKWKPHISEMTLFHIYHILFIKSDSISLTTFKERVARGHEYQEVGLDRVILEAATKCAKVSAPSLLPLQIECKFIYFLQLNAEAIICSCFDIFINIVTFMGETLFSS